ncbi:hypothetical protein Ocin01_18806 [Orchesella cincta]|uniref:Uncharacterized protein n=1 Tax=Orchesella cincta TaxID=48709 RepID=A0A1D2M4I0_ORCCI|nr:hypothetical protein Ocin01_18806 [Orchesella cincta]
MAKISSRRMALWAILIAASPLLVSSADVNYGLQMFGKAGRGACWIEKLNKLPTKEIENIDEYWQNCETRLTIKDNEWDEMYQFYATQKSLKGASEEK